MIFYMNANVKVPFSVASLFEAYKNDLMKNNLRTAFNTGSSHSQIWADFCTHDLQYHTLFFSGQFSPSRINNSALLTKSTLRLTILIRRR
jgi:hypothetical protein